ncbi:hypothetical protein FS749_012003 [Ceratobasidium sp. UAMH 11750]|nr:hypothetical protein FS749_012003 [Ceratobasidium sp. UAMH 11750]
MLPPGDAKLERYAVSAIFWQIRNRPATPLVEIDAERLGYFSPYRADTSSSVSADDANSRPYLTVALNLGAQVAKPPVTQTKDKSPPTQQTSNYKGKRSSEPIHPRYSISISGCSHTTFPSLVPTYQEHLYTSLLSPWNYAAEHARSGRAFQDEGGMGSYSQIKRAGPSVLDRAPPQDCPSEAVKVHEFGYGTGSGDQEFDEFEDTAEVDMEDDGVSMATGD